MNGNTEQDKATKEVFISPFEESLLNLVKEITNGEGLRGKEITAIMPTSTHPNFKGIR